MVSGVPVATPNPVPITDAQRKSQEEFQYFLKESTGYKEKEAVGFAKSKAPLN